MAIRGNPWFGPPGAFWVVVALFLLFTIGRRVLLDGAFSPGRPAVEAIVPQEVAPGTIMAVVGRNLAPRDSIKVIVGDAEATLLDGGNHFLSFFAPAEPGIYTLRVAEHGKATMPMSFRVLPPELPVPRGAITPAVARGTGGGMGDGGMGGAMGSTPAAMPSAPPQVPDDGLPPPATPLFDDSAGPDTPRTRFFSREEAPDAPDTAVKDAQGNPAQLKDFLDGIRLVNFWFSDCPPCLEELPSLEALAARISPFGAKIVTISVDEERERADRVMDRTKTATIPLWDPEGLSARLWGTSKYPETYLVVPPGKIVIKFVGPRDWNDPLYEQLFRTLAEKADEFGAVHPPSGDAAPDMAPGGAGAAPADAPRPGGAAPTAPYTP